MEQTSTTLTQAQAIQVVVRGVNREVKRGNAQARDLIHDAIRLQGFNVRKLATVAEANGDLSVGFDSYLSYMSNANGVAAMFEYDMEKVDAFLAETHLVGLSAIFRAFRDLFAEPKPAKPKTEKPASADDSEKTPLIDIVLSAIPHLTREERTLVSMMIVELDTADDDSETPELSEVA